MDIAAAQGFALAWQKALREGLTYQQFAGRLGVTHGNAAKRRRRVEAALGIQLESFAATPATKARAASQAKLRAFKVTSERPSDEAERPIAELVADRLKATGRRLRNDALRELVEIELDVSGPYAIAMIGDPHMDNPGCNLELLLAHTKLIAQTDGMFGVCVGDLQDNWVGRLARLWADQGIAARDSQRLVDWWLQQFAGKLLAICEGNHDCWSHGLNTLSPLAWIESKLGAVVERHGVRLRLSPHEGDPVTINMRHDFPGRSQYNPAHGPNKSLLFGIRDDVAVAGHTHEFGFGVRLDPETRKPMHAVRLGSYKHSDEYARTLGLLDNNVTEAATLLVNPSESDPRHRTWIETDPFRAAKILKMLRAEWRINKKQKSARGAKIEKR